MGIYGQGLVKAAGGKKRASRVIVNVYTCVCLFAACVYLYSNSRGLFPFVLCALYLRFRGSALFPSSAAGPAQLSVSVCGDGSLD